MQVQVTPKFKIKNRLSRSAIKTPRLKQRVFASLERQADKMINLLTPKKVKNPSPNVLKQAKVIVEFFNSFILNFAVILLFSYLYLILYIK